MDAEEGQLPENIDAIIFDLGGVILPLRHGATLQALADLLELDEQSLRTKLMRSPVFDDFERGQVSAAEFRQRLRVLGNTSTSKSAELPDDVLDHAWNAVLGRLPVTHLDLLLHLKSQKRIFLLSNTNEIHVQRLLQDFRRDYPDRTPWADHFEQAHYSHELGMRKPAPDIFQRLQRDHSLDPARTLFIDDTEENIQQARALGFCCYLHPSNQPLSEQLLSEQLLSGHDHTQRLSLFP